MWVPRMNFTGVLEVMLGMQRRLENLSAENCRLKSCGMRCSLCNWAAFLLFYKHRGNALPPLSIICPSYDHIALKSSSIFVKCFSLDGILSAPRCGIVDINAEFRKLATDVPQLSRKLTARCPPADIDKLLPMVSHMQVSYVYLSCQR